MPLSANLLKLGSSILPRAKRATSRNNVATKNESKKNVLVPDSPGAEMSGAETYLTPQSRTKGGEGHERDREPRILKRFYHV